MQRGFRGNVQGTYIKGELLSKFIERIEDFEQNSEIFM